MKQLLIDIITYLRDEIPDFLTISEWNNQIDEINEGEQYGFMLPACFIEIVNEREKIQLGNGATLYDPLYIKFHIIDEQLNMDTFTDNNNLDMNLKYYDYIASLYNKLYLHEFNKASGLVHKSDENDTQHTNIYHVISTFVTNYVDFTNVNPKNAISFSPNYIINKQIN
jgi:hypothetical protein